MPKIRALAGHLSRRSHKPAPTIEEIKKAKREFFKQGGQVKVLDSRPHPAESNPYNSPQLGE